MDVLSSNYNLKWHAEKYLSSINYEWSESWSNPLLSWRINGLISVGCIIVL